MKPTMPRMTAVADAARMMLAPRTSRRSVVSGASAAICTWGRRVARTAPVQNTATATPVDAEPPKSNTSNPPRPPPQTPLMALMSVSFELASISSSLRGHTAGTRAARETA